MLKSKQFKIVFSSLFILTVLVSGFFLGNFHEEEAMVYLLNFKPEIHEQMEDIAQEYENQTGVTVKVTTAASNQYEQTLNSEIIKKNAPTIFQVNGPVGYNNWSDYCADLSDTELYNLLTDSGKELAIEGDDGGIYGIPYTVEGYGIIYNDEIMQKYFNSANKSTTFTSVEEINGFDDLKAVVEDMTLLKDELGIEGVFASTSMAEGNAWRWSTHLLNIPLYYEFSENGEDPLEYGMHTDTIEFTYNENFKNIFDLYLNNSVTPQKLLSSKTVDDSMTEFALGNVAMVQNGTWGWNQIAGIDGNTVEMEDAKFMPIYTGVEGEENQGICVGTENYYAINSQVSEEKQQASLDFLTWLYSSEEGKKAVTEELGLITPFECFSPEELPKDNLTKELIEYLNDDGTSSTYYPMWVFEAFPSEAFKEEVSSSLLEYTQEQETWEQVTQDIIEYWRIEKEILNE